MLNSTTHDVGGILVITLEDAGLGAEDRNSSHREILYKTIQARDDPRFAVDLGRLDYMSSADFGFLISLRRRIDARKGKLVLFAVNAFIHDALKMMKLASLFEIVDDLPAALLLLPAPVA